MIKTRKIDWVIVCCYLFLLIFGWMNIYASSLSGFDEGFDWSARYGMQILWIGTAIILDMLILLVIPSRFFNVFAWWIYALTLGLLAITIFLGKEINGSHSWLVVGPFRIQPAEFSKIAVALALASLMEKYTFSFKNFRNTVEAFAILAVPMMLILLEKETGLMLVYAGFLVAFYREGMSGWIILAIPLAVCLFILTMLTSPYFAIVLWFLAVAIYSALHSRRYMWRIILFAVIGSVLLLFMQKLGRIEALKPVLSHFKPEIWLTLAAVPTAIYLLVKSSLSKRDNTLRLSVLAAMAGLMVVVCSDFAFNKILQDHQRVRIEQLLGLKDDPMGAGYNVHQSMIAIGSGGFTGKGFTQGTQTRFDFVPEQSTDFIFCTVGEEWGFLGALAVVICYGILIVRLYNSAERQHSRFARVYGYCIASCIFMHVMINMGMTIGLMPVIGIPLPMLSYGGSSLWCFSLLLFIYLRMCYESDY